MSSRLARIIVFFAAMQILGGHWFALQSVAWVGMIANYARGETLVIAIGKTFDGDHPCELCKVVKKALSEEQKQQITKMIVKLEAVLAPTLQLPLRPFHDWCLSSAEERGFARSVAPLTPPPC